MTDKSILVVGAGDTGKTHYFAQLVLRLGDNKGSVKFFEAPENLEPIEQAMKRLNQGRAAVHTVGQITNTVVLPIQFNDGARVRLEWPDYAGERLKDLVSRRHGGADWAASARAAHGWLLFVRHEHMRLNRDLLSRPVIDILNARKAPDDGEVPWTLQAEIIELLQMLLFLRRVSLRSQLRSPILAVALSCYDQYPEREKFPRPADALRSIAPMLADFIESNWQESARFVFGLSSLGKPLDKEKPDAEFLDSGPSANGWVVTPDANQILDITWPLVETLRRR